MKRVAIAGARGFVGHELIPVLLSRGHEVVALSRARLRSSNTIVKKITWIPCDLFSLKRCEEALKGVDTAIYLVHSMLPSARLSQGTFEDFDLILADNFARAAKANGVSRIIFLGGLIPDDPHLSKHLRSRLEVEETLRHHGLPLTVLRAGIVVGAAGSSFQMMYQLARRLPTMICPSWTYSRCQPISLDDAVACLAACVDQPTTQNQTFDIGGPDVLTYAEMLQTLGRLIGREPRIVRFPNIPTWLSTLWVSLISGAPLNLVTPLVSSLKHDMICSSKRMFTLASQSQTFDVACRDALNQGAHDKIPSSFRTSQKFLRDKKVRSCQRLPIPARRNAAWVAQEYLRWLSQFMYGIIRVRVDRNNDLCQFFLVGFRNPLLILELSAERSTPDRQLFYIRGGLLTISESRGRFEFRETLDHRSIIAAIHDFEPRLPWFVYKYTQALAHLLVMKRFARHLRRIAAR